MPLQIGYHMGREGQGRKGRGSSEQNDFGDSNTCRLTVCLWASDVVNLSVSVCSSVKPGVIELGSQVCGKCRM